MDKLLIPSSIQRIRSFLVEMCGMKVKPWASTEETLAALHSTLLAKRACGIFWDSLRTLLENLARDMKARASAEPGSVIDNEVLDDGRYQGLLDEIRQRLSQREPEAGFRPLSAALSAPALGLLLFLGGVASVGCARSSFVQAPGTLDAAADQDNSPCLEICGAPKPTDGGNAAIRKPDTQPATQRDTQANAPVDGLIRIIIPPSPDTSPGPDAVTRGPDGASVTIKDIMDSCNVPESDQQKVLACLASIDESWTTGVTAALAGAACARVIDQLTCMASDSSDTCPPTRDPKFVVGTTRICQPRLIYLGVSFV